MLKADSIGELYSMLYTMETEQIIQVPIKLLFKLWRKAEDAAFVYNFEQSEEKITHCSNKNEAQALASFLWNERERHIKDIHCINDDLLSLEVKWDVEPTRIRRFVKP